MHEAPWAFSIYWMYTVLVDQLKYGMDSRALLHRLEAQKIQTRPLWQPVHLSPAHKGMYATDCLVAEQLNQAALSLPCSVGLTHKEQQHVVENILRLRPQAHRRSQRLAE
jgi:perosamine synthetase